MERIFDLGTHQLVYRLKELPQAPKVLFLHGCGAGHDQFEREFDALSQAYSVASISMRGQGGSTRPAGGKAQDMTMPCLAADVLAWLEAHQWQKPHGIACSMGGVVALEMLKQQKGTWSSLTTFGTTPRLSLPKLAIKAGAWLTDVCLPGLFPNGMASAVAKATTDKPEARERFARDLRRACQKRRSVHQLRCDLAHYDHLPLLQSTDIPVLLLQGEKDRDINRQIDKLWPILGQNPKIQRQVIQDAGHIANYDQPEIFLEHVGRFLQEQHA